VKVAWLTTGSVGSTPTLGLNASGRYKPKGLKPKSFRPKLQGKAGFATRPFLAPLGRATTRPSDPYHRINHVLIIPSNSEWFHFTGCNNAHVM